MLNPNALTVTSGLPGPGLSMFEKYSQIRLMSNSCIDVFSLLMMFELIINTNGNNTDKNMSELNYGITLGRTPNVIYITKSDFKLNIQGF